jgi:hypothetical protein
VSHRGRRYFSLITISAGFLATSVSSLGADPGIGYSIAIAVPPHAAPAARRPIPAHPIGPPDTNPNPSFQRARIVDQLYDETMRSSACFLAASNASVIGGC